ncbi:hypothetical protein BKA70DRAFT_385217 [Coprinopsis sp. MPI-PUGE-AT-0042]|nr:hypothetical protein BKA70DRAFT_385217 [Coprinopsis sp. MPI-PUGE-AT-0042]
MPPWKYWYLHPQTHDQSQLYYGVQSLLRREHPPVAAYTSHPEKQDDINTCVVGALGDTTKAHVRITLLFLRVVDSIDKRTKIACYAYSTSKVKPNPKADGSYPVHHRPLQSERDSREEHAVRGVDDDGLGLKATASSSSTFSMPVPSRALMVHPPRCQGRAGSW